VSVAGELHRGFAAVRAAAGQINADSVPLLVNPTVDLTAIEPDEPTDANRRKPTLTGHYDDRLPLDLEHLSDFIWRG